MAYPTTYMYQQPYTQPYQDRLAQLQAQYNQTIPQMSVAQPQVNQGLLWVQGEAGAKSYLVAPSTTVLLMDSESQRFYLKSTDSAGMPNLRTFEYSEVLTNVSPQNDTDNLDAKYVTRNEYNSLKLQYEELLEKIDMFRTEPVMDVQSGKQSTRAAKNRGGNTDEQSNI